MIDLIAPLMDVTFAQWLLLRRRQLKISQGVLADALNVSPQTVSNWERGVSEPTLTIKQVQIFCEKLNCSLKEIPIDSDSQKQETGKHVDE